MASSSSTGTCQSLLLDCAYYPNWGQERLGLEPKAAFEQLQKMDFADRRAAHMRYRGNTLKRSKFFLVDDLTTSVPVYLYPGFQYGSIVQEYDLIASHPLVGKFCAALKADFGVGINHVIGTLYGDGADGIGYHTDKVKTIDPDTAIFIYSCGRQRPLCFRMLGEDKVEVRVPMEPGSLFVLGHRTNRAYEHAIEEDEQEGARISLVLRKIAYRVPMKTVMKKAAQTEKQRALREEKRRAAESDSDDE